MHGIWQNMIFFWLTRRKIKLESNISFGSCLLYASIRVQQFPYINLFRQDYYSSTEKSLNRPEIQFESEIMLETECLYTVYCRRTFLCVDNKYHKMINEACERGLQVSFQPPKDIYFSSNWQDNLLYSGRQFWTTLTDL